MGGYFDAVMRWLRGRPGHKLAKALTDEDLAIKLRWIEDVEEFDESVLPLPSGDFPLNDESPNFLIACVVHSSETDEMKHAEGTGIDSARDDYEGMDSGGRQLWPEKVLEAMTSWPKEYVFGAGAHHEGHHDAHHEGESTGVKTVGTTNIRDFIAILETLDSEGSVTRAVHINGVSLHPGDTLILRGTVTVDDLISRKVRPTQLEFAPCPTIATVGIYAQGYFVDFHHAFTGFREGLNLQTTSEAGTLSEMAAEVNRVNTKRDHGTKKMPPRRIRGLSARRDPLQAARSGCA